MEVYSIPMRHRFRGIDHREGVLLRGPAGWGEFSPFADYADAECVPWLASALEASTQGWPEPVRDTVEVNTTVPVLAPGQAHQLVASSGCRTVKVKVADTRSSLTQDCARVAAVRDALGHSGAIRVDANAMWDVTEAAHALTELDRAAEGLEYAEQPCPSIGQLAELRRKVNVRIAADESIRHASDPLRVALAGAADIAVLKVAPLGGVRRALEVADACGLPCVVSSAVETSVGLAAGLALAGALPRLDHACGLGTLSLLTGDVTQDSLSAVDGSLPVPLAPPEPDPALLGSTAADGARATSWRERIERVRALAPLELPAENTDVDRR